MTRKIRLFEGDLDEARAYSARVHASKTLQTTENPNGYSHPHRYVTGRVGEIAVARMFWEEGIKAVPMNNDQGRSDDGDFLVHGKLIDVKTARHNAEWSHLFTVSQVQHERHGHKRDLYLATRVQYKGRSPNPTSATGAVVVMVGVITPQAFTAICEPLRTNMDSLAVELYRLRPFRGWLEEQR